MNTVCFAAIVLTGALISEVHTVDPCVLRTNQAAYDTFADRHILSGTFDRNSLDEWERYLRGKYLCGREGLQSFIDARANAVKGICKNSGRRIRNAPPSQSDFCISQRPMTVYHVQQGQGCQVTDIRRVEQYVVVRCFKVDRTCLPIHYEAYRNQQPTNTPCSRPFMDEL